MYSFFFLLLSILIYFVVKVKASPSLCLLICFHLLTLFCLYIVLGTQSPQNISAGFVSLYSSVHVSRGKSESRLLKKRKHVPGKQKQCLLLTPGHGRGYTQSTNVPDDQGPHRPASRPQSISAASTCVCVCGCVCGCVSERVWELYYKCWGVEIKAIWYPGVICQFAAERSKVTGDRIMSGEHSWCIWSSRWEVQSSDYTPIREQCWVKTCQFPALTWAQCEKLRNDCSNIARTSTVGGPDNCLYFVYPNIFNIWTQTRLW